MSLALTNYIRAGYPGLYVVSPEELRVEAEFRAIADRLAYRLHFWSVVDGLVDVASKTVKNANDPLEALEAVGSLPEKSLVLLKDFHLFLSDPNPILLRKLKDTLLLAKMRQKVIVILGCRLCLPPELERELTVIEFQLPGKEELRPVLAGIIESAKLPGVAVEVREKAVEAASGLTTMEAENA
ncbi:MAG: ATPase, partial [Limisphaerales bacterium]